MSPMSRWAWGVGALLALLSGCARQRPAEVAAACTGPTASLKGLVVDDRTSQPLAHVLLALEKGGLFEVNPTPTRAAPSYTYGAQADTQGHFEFELPCGTVGLHAFVEGYRCGTASTASGEVVRVALEPVQPQDPPPPRLSNASLQPSTVGPGGQVTMQVTAAAGSSGDPLSEAVLAIAPELGASFALDPPPEGVLPIGFADGEWMRTFAAPSTPGTYVYSLVAVSEGCISSASTPLTLTVQ